MRRRRACTLGPSLFPMGVNAIWDISRDDARAKRFVSAQAE
jgi:hypothetical protein